MANELKPNTTGTGWTVTGQQESTELYQGSATRGMRVSFQTGRGLAGSVFVPLAMYSNPENVRAAIAQYVAQMHQVQDLTG